MTSPVRGSSFVIPNREWIEEKLKENILANQKQQVGPEVEAFLVNASGEPITRGDARKVFEELHRHFAEEEKIVGVDAVHEDYYGRDSLVAVKVPGLGAFQLEPGQQFEIAASVCDTPGELKEKLGRGFAALQQAAEKRDHRVIYTGYQKGFAETTERAMRTRAYIWHDFSSQFDQNTSTSIRRAQYGTASTQLTFDSGAEKFNEIFSAFLILEAAFALKYNNTPDRLEVINAYADAFPMQLRPISAAWQAKTVDESVKHIVDRVLKFEVPFLNDPQDLIHYRLNELKANGRPLTVEELMIRGRGELTHHNLLNIFGLFYTGPAFRKFDACFHELRLADSTDSLDKIEKMTQIAMELAYNPDTRKRFLESVKFLTPDDIDKMHKAAANPNRRHALNMRVTNGYTIEQIVEYMLDDGHVEALFNRRTFSLPSLPMAAAQVELLSATSGNGGANDSDHRTGNKPGSGRRKHGIAAGNDTDLDGGAAPISKVAAAQRHIQSLPTVTYGPPRYAHPNRPGRAVQSPLPRHVRG